MSENKKSIIERALIDFDLMQESLRGNTEDIFRSMAKDEVKSSLKENVSEAEYDEEDVDNELENDTDDSTNMDSDDATGVEDEMGDDSAIDTDLDQTMAPEDSEDYIGGEDSEDYTIDMTGSDDEELISVFKKMGDNDGVEVVSDNEVKITTPDGGEYQIKMGGASSGDPVLGGPETAMPSLADAPEMGGDALGLDDAPEMNDDESEEEEEDGVMFEIALDADDEVIEEDIVRGKGHDKYAGGGSLPTGNIEGQKAPMNTDLGDNLDGGFDDKAVKYANAEGPMVMQEEDLECAEEEETIEEQIPVGLAQGKRVPATNAVNAGIVGAGAADLATQLAETKAKYNKLLAEAKRLTVENQEFTHALVKLRKGLGETGLYTRNLSSATKLFLEHTTTKQEKFEIMKRFDNVKSIKESKELEKIISNELTTRKPLTESIEGRFSSSPASSVSKTLQESKTYVHPSIARALELMTKKQ